MGIISSKYDRGNNRVHGVRGGSIPPTPTNIAMMSVQISVREISLETPDFKQSV